MSHCHKCRSELKTSDSPYGHIFGCGGMERCECSDSHSHPTEGRSPWDWMVQLHVLQAAYEKAFNAPLTEADAMRFAETLGTMLRGLPP